MVAQALHTPRSTRGSPGGNKGSPLSSGTSAAEARPSSVPATPRRDCHSSGSPTTASSSSSTSLASSASGCCSLAARWEASPPRSWCGGERSEEHTSELQSRGHLVCRLLLEKKKQI